MQRPSHRARPAPPLRPAQSPLLRAATSWKPLPMRPSAQTGKCTEVRMPPSGSRRDHRTEIEFGRPPVRSSPRRSEPPASRRASPPPAQSRRRDHHWRSIRRWCRGCGSGHVRPRAKPGQQRHHARDEWIALGTTCRVAAPMAKSPRIANAGKLGDARDIH